MKKHKTLLALACVVLLVVGSVAPAVAKTGAVKADLLDMAKNPVGKVIVTPTAAGKYEVTAVIKSGVCGGVTQLELWSRIVGDAWDFSIFSLMKENAQGKGAGHLSVPIDASVHSSGDVVSVEVWIGTTESAGWVQKYQAVVTLVTLK